ncbi:MAG: ankyrin repeat domain-containing protein, partial [Verrucomicrobium sp.]
LPVPEGAFAFVDCHGGWNVALQNHTLELGKQELVPTSEVIRVLYEKGVRKMTFVSCFILNGAEGITRLINSDPDWPKPLDRNMEITFVGSHSESLVGSNLYDLHNRMRDYVALKGKGEGGSMERLTVSSRSILTWDQEKGEVVMTHHGSPKDADRGDLTEEQRKTVQGNLLLKRTDHILLPDRVEPAAPIKPATTTTTTSTISTTATTTTTTTTAATAAATATTSLADSTATTTTVSSSTPKPNTTETKRLQRLREMLARPETNVNYQDSQGFTALSLAVGLGSPEAVALLLQHPDVDVNLTNVNGDTPLHGAGYGKTGSRSQEVVELLVKGNGILINKKTQTGATPLYIAAQEGHTGMVEVLLRQKGIEINVPDSAGATPLYVAAQNGHLEVVRLLLANKAGLNCRYGDPIEAARSEQHTEIVKMLEEAKKQSAPVLRYRDRGNMPSLLMAAQLGQVKTVTKLLNMEGVPVNRPDSKGVNPLHGAAESGQTEVVKLLLEVDGIEVNGRTPLGRTALYAAAAKGHIDVVKLLLAKKADLTCDKEDPVDIARKNQHHDIVKLLEEAGSTGKAAKSPSDDCITM